MPNWNERAREELHRVRKNSAIALVDELEAEESDNGGESEEGEAGEAEISRAKSKGESGREAREKKKEKKEEKKTVFVVDYQDNIELLSVQPEPFIEPAVKPYETDRTDAVLPDPGFLTDFANCGRGMETPALFYMMAGIWAIATALARETWIKWDENFKLWPNIYTLLVAPPSLCKKSTVIDMANKLVRTLPDYMPDSLEAAKKRIDIVNGKTTPEGLLTFMQPKKTTMIDERDKQNPAFVEVSHGSLGAISVGEFATFLGKQKYNIGMIPILTDLYDCAEATTEVTRGAGAITLTNIYTNLLGGITRDGLRLSIPEEAFGGGFMSRCLVAYVETPIRYCPFPTRIPGYPRLDDLYAKFAWIIARAKGEYSFTQEAIDYYSAWYMRWKKKLVSSGMEKQDTFRMDSILIRVSCILRIQDYTEGKEIGLKHIKAAQKLLEELYKNSGQATDEIGRTDESVMRMVIEKVLKRRGSMDRRKLAVYMSPRKCTSTVLMSSLMELYEEGMISISLDGHPLNTVSKNSKELYTYIGTDEEEGDDDE